MPCCIVTARRGLLSLDNVFTVNGHEPTTHPVAQVTIEKGAVPMGTAPFVLGKTLCLVVLVQAAAVIGGPALNIYLTARPRPSASAGTGSVMTEPAATSAPSPI